MDVLLWLLFAVAATSAAVASLVTWCLVAPRQSHEARMGQRPVLHDSDESEDGGVTMLPGTHTLDSNSRFFLSSAGKTLHLFATCPGRNARLQTFRVCINCLARIDAGLKRRSERHKGSKPR